MFCLMFGRFSFWRVCDVNLIGKDRYPFCGVNMCSTPEKTAYSTENAMQKLAKALQVVSANSELYYLKKPVEVAEAALREVEGSFAEVEALLAEFAEQWFNSNRQCVNG